MLTIRSMNADALPDTPRHWANGNAFVTHFLNTYGVLVPGNEGFYIRTLRAISKRLTDPALLHEVDLFARQEGQHGVAHKRAWNLLDQQGYRFRGAIRALEKPLYWFTDNVVPLRLRVAMVACVEHINAFVGYEFLAQRILEGAPTRMRAIYEWHFAEEIEHRAVALDVLRAVSGGYALRMAGALLTIPLFYLLMSLGMLWFAAQDGSLFKPTTWCDGWRHLFSRHGMAWRSLKHLAAYLSPRFDARKLGGDDLAAATMQRWDAHLTAIHR
jgi:hypothetical protein